MLDGIASVEADLGPVDILINNAGITRDGTVHKMDYENWQAVIDTNLGSCFNMSRAVIEGMRERKFGRIVNVGSINGQAGQYGQVKCRCEIRYTALQGSRSGRCGQGITVNAIAPGYIDTDMVAAVPDRVLDKIIERIPVGRWERPQRSPGQSAF